MLLEMFLFSFSVAKKGRYSYERRADAIQKSKTYWEGSSVRMGNIYASVDINRIAKSSMTELLYNKSVCAVQSWHPNGEGVGKLKPVS